VRQLLTESVVLSGAGAALGLALAVAGTRLLAGAEGLDLPLLDSVRVDWAVLGFAAGAALLTGILVGVAPAARASRRAVHQALREAGRAASAGPRHGTARGALVVAEVALACVLLVGAGLLARSFLRLLDVELGFRPEHAVAVRIDPSRRFSPRTLRTAYYDDALRRLRAAPGLQAVGLTDVLPMAFNRMWSVAATGRSYARDERPHAFIRVVSEGYLRAMGVALLAGRDFTAADDTTARPVAIVNETLARTLWPGESPLGRTLDPGGGGGAVEVVGVVAGTRHQALDEASGAELYLPMRQVGDYSAVHVVARGPLAPPAIAAAVRAALRPMDPTLPMTEVRTLRDIVDRSVSPRRLVVQLVTGFAGFALVLAALGIYAVISYGVTQRTREFGVRLALGAPAGALRARVLGQTLRLAAAGAAVGLAGAWAFARTIRGLLFGVTVSDPLTFAAALALLGAVAALAGYLPARRASRLSPVEALRAE
jgi:predicted permease